jgi:predicted secreted protein
VTAGQARTPDSSILAEPGRRPVAVPLTLSRQARPRLARRDVELDQADHGRTIEIPIGEEFLLRLPENPDDGYAWQFTGTVDRLLVVVGSRLEEAAPTPPADATGPRASRDLVIRLRGRREGTAVLRLSLTRPWGGKAIQSFQITVRVVEQGDGPHGLSSD